MSPNENKQTSKQGNRRPFEAGVATTDITPQSSQFLFGYPYVRRFSTGVHDPLLSSALYVSDGETRAIFVANDIVCVSKTSTARIRERVSALTSVPSSNIMITATHTHSGPKTLDLAATEDDPTDPPVAEEYVRFMEEMIASAAAEAVRKAGPAEVGLGTADGSGVGTNRRDPKGPADPEVPVLMVRSLPNRENLACMVVYSMHPTVLHEDSTLVSADFPGMTRQYLQREILGPDCPVLYHTGPAGNQSPRYSTTANTFAEAERLGYKLGEAIAKAIPCIHYATPVSVTCRQESVELPPRSFPSVKQARAELKSAKERLRHLRATGTARPVVRTAEVDWFGAELSLTLAQAHADQRLAQTIEACKQAEIQMIKIGPWAFVGWQGEIFVEYALEVKAKARNTYLISLANGELQGYIVTEKAATDGAYEAASAVLAPASGKVFVKRTLEMLASAADEGGTRTAEASL